MKVFSMNSAFPTVSDATNKRLRRAASMASLLLASSMIILKLIATIATDSLSLMGSLIDGTVDMIASVLTFIGVRYSGRPADQEHRFGHGKGEALAAFLQAVFLAFAAIALGVSAAYRFVVPAPIHQLSFGLIITIVSTFVTGALILFQGYVIRHTASVAIIADRAHYTNDLLVNMSVVAALFLTYLTEWSYFDAVFTMMISALMMQSAASIAKTSTDTLLDRELPQADRQRIINMVMRCPDVKGIHDLRTRNAGDRLFIEFHLEIDGNFTVEAGHRIADKIELLLSEAFIKAEVMVHQEPSGIIDERLDKNLDQKK